MFRLWCTIFVLFTLTILITSRQALAQYCQSDANCDPWQSCNLVASDSDLKACKDLPNVH
jgi:hypothetical protein